jgi:hypothetical protein
MTDEIYIHEARALRILMSEGDYAESQARIILAHSRQQLFGTETYYPASYIAKRARQGAERNPYA